MFSRFVPHCKTYREGHYSKNIGGTDVICAKVTLTVTIRFLATGEIYRSLSFSICLSRSALETS